LQNVYGAGQSIKNPYTGVLATFANLCIAGEGLNVYEDGQCARDFVHVKDVAKVLSNFNFLTANTDDSIDLGSGKPVRLIDVANFISKFLKCSATPIISGNFRVGDIRSNFSEVPISTYLNQTETDFWNEGLPEFLEFAGENFEQKNLELIELAKKESISANVLRSN
jgi:dTDP-L-rhamnose 4-epimerase